MPPSRRLASGCAARSATAVSPSRPAGSRSTSPRPTCARPARRSTWRSPSGSCSAPSRSGRPGRWAFIGELSLGGELRPVPGMLPMVVALVRRRGRPGRRPGRRGRRGGSRRPSRRPTGGQPGRRRRAPPQRRVAPAADGSTPPAGSSSGVAIPDRDGARTRSPSDGATGAGAAPARDVPDLADVRGQALGRRALEIALAGGHGLLLIGPPGSGKTLLARTIPRAPAAAERRARPGSPSAIASVGRRRPAARTSSGRARSGRRTTRSATPGCSAADRGSRPGEVTRAERGRPVPRRAAGVRAGRPRGAPPAARGRSGHDRPGRRRA